MTNIPAEIVDLIKNEWTPANTTEGFTPEVSPDFQMGTWSARHAIFIHELGSQVVIEDCSNGYHRIEGSYQLDCYSDDETAVYEMREEIDRIFNANPLSPTDSVDLMLPSAWRNNSFLEVETYRMTLEFKVRRYVSTGG